MVTKHSAARKERGLLQKGVVPVLHAAEVARKLDGCQVPVLLFVLRRYYVLGSLQGGAHQITLLHLALYSQAAKLMPRPAV